MISIEECEVKFSNIASDLTCLTMAQQEVKEENQDNAEKLEYPEPIVIKPGAKHTATILWLHGLAGSGRGCLDSMQQVSANLPYIKFILPTAPKRSIACNGGAVLNAWYHCENLQQVDINEYGENSGKLDSAKFIDSLIEHEISANGISPDRILLGGHSMGGAQSIYSGLLCSRQIAAIICCSGYLLDEEPIAKSKNIKTPMFMFHGDKDTVVPTKLAKNGFATLKAAGCNIEWKAFQIAENGHSLSEDVLKEVIKQINAHLPGMN